MGCILIPPKPVILWLHRGARQLCYWVVRHTASLQFGEPNFYYPTGSSHFLQVFSSVPTIPEQGLSMSHSSQTWQQRHRKWKKLSQSHGEPGDGRDQGCCTPSLYCQCLFNLQKGSWALCQSFRIHTGIPYPLRWLDAYVWHCQGSLLPSADPFYGHTQDRTIEPKVRSPSGQSLGNHRRILANKHSPTSSEIQGAFFWASILGH